MKRNAILLLLAVLTTSCEAGNVNDCSSVSDSELSYIDKNKLEEEYSEYLVLTNIDSPSFYYGIVCCWETKKDEWRCGIFMDNSSDMKLWPFTLMQENKPCTLETMSSILSLFYDNTDPYLFVCEIEYPITENDIPMGFHVSSNEALYERLSLISSYTYNVLRWQESDWGYDI